MNLTLEISLKVLNMCFKSQKFLKTFKDVKICARSMLKSFILNNNSISFQNTHVLSKFVDENIIFHVLIKWKMDNYPKMDHSMVVIKDL